MVCFLSLKVKLLLAGWGQSSWLGVSDTGRVQPKVHLDILQERPPSVAEQPWVEATPPRVEGKCVLGLAVSSPEQLIQAQWQQFHVD